MYLPRPFRTITRQWRQHLSKHCFDHDISPLGIKSSYASVCASKLKETILYQIGCFFTHCEKALIDWFGHWPALLWTMPKCWSCLLPNVTSKSHCPLQNWWHIFTICGFTCPLVISIQDRPPGCWAAKLDRSYRSSWIWWNRVNHVKGWKSSIMAYYFTEEVFHPKEQPNSGPGTLTLQSCLHWSSLVLPRSHPIEDVIAVSLSVGYEASIFLL